MNSTYIIAEIGINHNGSLDTALKLIYKAYEAGVDAVKFQKRNLKEIYTKDILDDPNSAEWNFEYLIPLLKEVELSKKDYVTIKRTCKKLNLDLIITPMDEDSVEFVGELGVNAFKVASADMTNLSLIKKCSIKATKFQSGFIYQYAFVMLLGFSALLTFLIVK